MLYKNLKVKIEWLPPYSPEFNPIELLFGWVKNQLKQFYLMDIEVHDAVAGILTSFVEEKLLLSFVRNSVSEWLK